MGRGETSSMGEDLDEALEQDSGILMILNETPMKLRVDPCRKVPLLTEEDLDPHCAH